MKTIAMKYITTLISTSILNIEHGYHHEALQGLIYALRLVHKVCSIDASSTFDFINRNERNRTRMSFFQLHKSSSVTKSITGGGFNMFNHALMVEINEPSSTYYCDNKSLKRLSAAILYNIALCHHREGIIKGNSTRELRKALRSYKSVYYVLAEAIEDAKGKDDLHFLDEIIRKHSSNAHTNMMKLLLLAVCNNLGHIYAYFYEREESLICHKIIKRNLNMLNSPSLLYQHENEAMAFFFEHLLLSPIDPFSIATAA